ncbi:hypothetical protein EVA_12472 [gut metagenome]|uniref:Uncharacterized protein n=1 Tax=gut metagenome TaxID=749906 RepID=J9FWQ4_9ZZZZ
MTWTTLLRKATSVLLWLWICSITGLQRLSVPTLQL